MIVAFDAVFQPTTLSCHICRRRTRPSDKHMFKNIVVTIDGSEPSSHALAVGVDVAKQYGARLTIVHAIMSDTSLAELKEVARSHGFSDQIAVELDEATSVRPIPDLRTAASLAVIPEEMLEKIGKLLVDEIASKARALGLEEVETAVLGEDAAWEILNYAETNDVDLIVSGTRGLGGIKSLFLGSVSHKLLKEAKCPCLLVK